MHWLIRLFFNKNYPVYQGNVQIYLEGQGALQVVDAEHSDRHIYCIGSAESKIVVKDYRQEPIGAAKTALQEEPAGFEFADVFNQPAKVKIYRTKKGFEIELYKGLIERDAPILWMGIIHNHQIPARKIYWKILKPINQTDVAFVILTPQIRAT